MSLNQGARSSDGSPSSSLDSTVTNEALKRFNKKHLRLIISGKTVETFWTSRPVATKKVLTKKPKKKKRKIVREEDRTDEYRSRSATRAKNYVKQLALSNFDAYNSKLFTITFADTDEFDITSPDDCHPKLKNFLKRLKRRYPKLKYIGVGEFQTENNRMAVHYHLLVNLPFVKQEKLQDIWGLGIVDIRLGSQNQASKIAYITKYITKENKYRYKTRRYFSSYKLRKPVVLYGDSAEKALERFKSSGWKISFGNSYYNPFLGETDYFEYNQEHSPAPRKKK